MCTEAVTEQLVANSICGLKGFKGVNRRELTQQVEVASGA